ncbi:MAG: hypothetical protein OWQ56_11525 [Acidithiobacillus caldus]|nr:hypothetical protein [Acidithiobacillus caldus]
MTTIMKPQVAAHYLTRRAIRRYPDIPEDDNKAYLAMFTSVLNIMAGAAASGELRLVAWPLWWPIPASMAVDDDGRIVDGAGVTDTALYEWVKTFDPDVAANKQTVEDFLKELQGDKPSDEAEAVMSDGVRVVGDFSHGNKSSWYQDNALNFALAAGRAGCRMAATDVSKWITENIPEAKGSSREVWRSKILKSELLRQAQEILNKERWIAKNEN